MILPILKSGADELSQVAEEVPIEEDVSELICDMYDTMYDNKGIGLAANQVGVLKRIAIIKYGQRGVAIINPKIVKRNLGTTTSEEGCLSFPNRTAYVKRSKAIVVEGYDEYWHPIKLKLRGLESFCAQHEIDHLDGVTM